MREFQYNEEEMKADKEEMTRLSTDKKKQFVSSCIFKEGRCSLFKSDSPLVLNLKRWGFLTVPACAAADHSVM